MAAGLACRKGEERIQMPRGKSKVPGDEQEVLATTKQPVSQDFSRSWFLACAPDLALQESTSAPGLALRRGQCFRHQFPVSGERLTPEAHHLSTCFLNQCPLCGWR